MRFTSLNSECAACAGHSIPCPKRRAEGDSVRAVTIMFISLIVVYKLDRISRSILDFANMMELFQKYNVEFVSSTEKFYPDGPGNAQHLYHSQDNGKQV